MATGVSAYQANTWLNSLSTNFVKLHVGDPGSLGTANPAVETTRKSVSFGAASGGVCVSSSLVSWTNIAGSETATFFTVWDAVSGGNFLFSGSITALAYTAGDTLNIGAGAMTVSLTVAS